MSTRHLAVLGLFMLCAPIAAAESLEAGKASSSAKAKASSETVRRFGEHVTRGLDHFKQEHWDEALAEYWAAYDINPVPLLLFNAAQAQRRAGRWDEALSLYERFLADDPRNPIAPEAEAHASAMRANRDRDRLNAELKSAQTVADTRAKEAATFAEMNQELRENVNRMLVAGELKAHRSTGKRTWLWGVAGGAAAVTLAVGLGVGLSFRLPSSELGAQKLSF